jgi:K+-transporting ATPase KdpF subunit
MLGVHQSLRQDVGEFMDYAIAGMVSAGLFVYLVYALLRAERF